MLALTHSSIPVAEYYPKQARKSTTGHGNARKSPVPFTPRHAVDLPDEKLAKVATDALAVAWCHLMKQNSIQNRIPKSNRKTHQNNSQSSWENFVANNPDRIAE